MPLPENFQLRDAGAADAAALALVAQASFLGSFVGTLRGEDILGHCSSQLSESKFAKYLALPDSRFALAEVKGAPVGYAMLYPPDLPMELRAGDIELKRIYVLPRFHGAGVGRALMDWSLQRARDLGMRRLLLGVYEGNAAALAFYARHGFETCGTRVFQVGPGMYSDLLLARDL